MNLLDVKKKLEQKNKKRNQLLGQNQMLMESLEEQGFKSTKEAKEEIKKLMEKKKKLKARYEEKNKLFMERYGELLND